MNEEKKTLIDDHKESPLKESSEILKESLNLDKSESNPSQNLIANPKPTEDINDSINNQHVQDNIKDDNKLNSQESDSKVEQKGDTFDSTDTSAIQNSKNNENEENGKLEETITSNINSLFSGDSNNNISQSQEKESKEANESDATVEQKGDTLDSTDNNNIQESKNNENEENGKLEETITSNVNALFPGDSNNNISQSQEKESKEAEANDLNESKANESDELNESKANESDELNESKANESDATVEQKGDTFDSTDNNNIQDSRNNENEENGKLEETITSNVNALFSGDSNNNISQSQENESDELNESKANETDEGESNDLFVAPVEKALTPPRHSNVTTMDEDQIRFSISLFNRKGTLPEKDERPVVLQHIQKQYIQYAIDRDYDKAKEMYDLNLRFLDACHKSDNSDLNYAKTDEIDTQIITTQNLMQDSNEQWMNKISELRIQEDSKIETTKIEQMAELQNFELKWADVENLRSYAKPSSTLNELRATEKKMILAKMYGPAKYIKGLADAQQEKETRAAQRRAQDDIMNKRNLMIQRHQIQIERIQEMTQKSINIIEKKRSVQEKAYKERIKHLERARTQLIRPTTTMSRNVQPQILGVKSPRTLKTEHLFRKSAPVKHLQLKPLSEFTKTSQAKLKTRTLKSSSQRKEETSNQKDDLNNTSNQEE